MKFNKTLSFLCLIAVMIKPLCLANSSENWANFLKFIFVELL